MSSASALWQKRFPTILGELAPDLDPSDSSQAAISVWLDALTEWNQKMDLTAARSTEETVDLMLADAIVLLRLSRSLVPRDTDWMDVGSGAGAPGLALALLEPTLHVRLVEPLAKRVSFLRWVVGKTGAQNVEVMRARCEQLSSQIAEAVVSRATFPCEQWLEHGSRLTQNTTWVLLAREEPPKRTGFSACIDHQYLWPLTRQKRRLVGYRRTAE